jgi:hypothetical protein
MGLSSASMSFVSFPNSIWFSSSTSSGPKPRNPSGRWSVWPSPANPRAADGRFCCPVRLRPHPPPRCRPTRARRPAPAHAWRSLAWLRRSSHQTPQRRHSTSQRQPWRSGRTRGYPRGGRVLRRRRECLPRPARSLHYLDLGYVPAVLLFVVR